MELTERSSHPAYRIYQFAWRSLDWLFPPTCGGCNQPGDRLCINCRKAIQAMPSNICPRCGEPVSRRGICEDCRKDPPAYTQLRSFAVYNGPIREALKRLKFRRNISLGETLSTYLIDYYPKLKWTVDLVVPVPLSSKRLRERGYNQVEYLARPFTLAFGLQYAPNALGREKDNPSQVGLTGELRRKNVIGAFKADANRVRGRRVLVIDDISTTGATMEACARALIEAGAQEVYGMTLARAILGTPLPAIVQDQDFQSDRSTLQYTKGGLNGSKG